ncbi:MAG: VTT domain-containing protein [Rhodocyclales bacterium]|nr:VTT domain-containing protein [Rhodocyclales bacterium]
MKLRLLLLPLLLLLAILAALLIQAVSLPGMTELGRHREDLVQMYREHPLLVTLAFFLLQVLISALSLPGSAVLLLAAGAGWGVVGGTLLCLSGCTLGATLTMLCSRHVLRQRIQLRFGAHLAVLNLGLERDGALYLFSLRMFPVIPFVAVNLLAGLTPLRTWTFAWVSFLGMLAGTLVYVNAGAEIAHVHSIGDVFSPGMLAALAAAGLLPLLTKRLLDQWRAVRFRAGSRP